MSGLEVHNVVAGYSSIDVVRDVSLTVGEGAALGMLGRNGVGKTTLIHAMMGLLRPKSGRVVIGGKDVTGKGPAAAARAGMRLVPQGRRVFGPLTVEENLRIAHFARYRDDWDIPKIYDFLPALARRRGVRSGLLSGGEQQMLAIGRALIASPDILLLDEPLEGLAPVVVDDISEVLFRLRSLGLTFVLVEHNIQALLGLVDAVCIMHRGSIAYHGEAAELKGQRDVISRLLGVGGDNRPTPSRPARSTWLTED